MITIFPSKIQLKQFTLIISLILCFTSFGQGTKHDTTHYILDANSSSEFFDEVYNSIDTVERVFISTCFYYVELLKEKRVFIDSFDLFSSKNYFLIKSILAKNENLYGYHKSTYFTMYFRDHTDSITRRKMNEILDSVNYVGDFGIDHRGGLDRLFSEIDINDSSLVIDFLDLLPEEIKNDDLVYNIHRGMLLNFSSFWKYWYVNLNNTRNDLIVNYEYHTSLLYGGNLEYLSNQNLGKPVVYHVNLREIKTINPRKLRRNLKRSFNLKAMDFREGGEFRLSNGQTVKIYV